MVNQEHRGLPAHLAGLDATGMKEGEPIAQYELGTGRNFVYLLLDWSAPFGSRKAAIIDPQSDLEGVLRDLSVHGFELQAILLTHTHYDHVAGVAPLLKMNPGLTIRVGEPDLHRLSESVTSSKGLKTLVDHESFQIGALTVVAHHTPGHSAGEFCFYIDRQPVGGVTRPFLFTGDLIFIRDCGRTDFPDGSDAQMFVSVQKIKSFPDETVLLVGHHYARECATTLGVEKTESPPFLCASVEELARL